MIVSNLAWISRQTREMPAFLLARLLLESIEFCNFRRVVEEELAL
jgi:hypothetical protein